VLGLKLAGAMKAWTSSQGDEAMVAPDLARHYGVAKPLDTPADPSAGFVFQYEVALTEGLECGGAYAKLLTATDSLDLSVLDGDTPYTIMFGPDKCGGTNKVTFLPAVLCPTIAVSSSQYALHILFFLASSHNAAEAGRSQVHLIMRHKSPKTGAVEEKHLKSPPMVKTDKLPHLYTLILKPDNTYGQQLNPCRHASAKCACARHSRGD
jgi:calnexin